MKKIILMIVAFVFAHLVLAWLFWASGYDFDKRGIELSTFACLAINIGSLAAFIIFRFYEEKK